MLGPNLTLPLVVLLKVIFQFFQIQIQTFPFLQQFFRSSYQLFFFIGQFFNVLECPLTTFFLHFDFLTLFVGEPDFELLCHFFKGRSFLFIRLVPVGKVIFLKMQLKLQRIKCSSKFNDFKFDVLEFVHIFKIFIVLLVYFTRIILKMKIFLLLYLKRLLSGHHLL